MNITVEKFKNIENIPIDISGITILVGGNNAGKSSILQAMQFGISVAQTSSFQNSSWNSGRLSTSIGQSDLLYTPIKDVHALSKNGRLKEAIEDAIQISYKEDELESKITVRKGKNKNILIEIVGEELGSKLQSIEKPYCALVTGLAGIPSEEEYETSIIVRKAAAKGNSNSVFRNILLQLSKDEKKWGKFLKQLNEVFPGYNISIQFDETKDETIRCIVEKDGVSYPIDTCGTGILQAIQIFSYINLFEPKILLLDEPDSHLHPNNQKKLTKIIENVVEDGLSVIIATHSKYLIESLYDESTILWIRDGSLVEDTDEYEIKALIDIGALNAGEVLRNPKYIFLAEDKNYDLFKTLLESSGFDNDEFEIVPYAGCTKIGTAVALISHLRKTNKESKFAIYRDRDYQKDDEIRTYTEKFNGMGVKVFIPKGNDIESYFVSKDHVIESCSVDDAVAQEIIENAFSKRKDELITKYVNTRIENDKKIGIPIDAGKIAAEAAREIIDINSSCIHGKTLIKGIKDELREKGISDKLNSITKSLCIDELKNIFVV